MIGVTKSPRKGLAVSPTPDHTAAAPPSLDDLISLQEAAELSSLSAGHLRLLASQGKLWAKKLGRNWVTTARAVEDYLAEDRRPGPKPKEPGNS